MMAFLYQRNILEENVTATEKNLFVLYADMLSLMDLLYLLVFCSANVMFYKIQAHYLKMHNLKFDPTGNDAIHFY